MSCDHHKEQVLIQVLNHNDLANKDTFKYLPCCYKTNPEHKRGSLMEITIKEKL